MSKRIPTDNSAQEALSFVIISAQSLSRYCSSPAEFDMERFIKRQMAEYYVNNRDVLPKEGTIKMFNGLVEVNIDMLCDMIPIDPLVCQQKSEGVLDIIERGYTLNPELQRRAKFDLYPYITFNKKYQNIERFFADEENFTVISKMFNKQTLFPSTMQYQLDSIEQICNECKGSTKNGAVEWGANIITFVTKHRGNIKINCSNPLSDKLLTFLLIELFKLGEIKAKGNKELEETISRIIGTSPGSIHTHRMVLDNSIMGYGSSSACEKNLKSLQDIFSCLGVESPGREKLEDVIMAKLSGIES